MKETAVPHDAAYKSIFSHPEMVESLLREFVPSKYLEGIQFETLAPLKSDFVSDKLQKRFADSVWKVKCGGVTHFILVHLEFQSTVDTWMAVRMANYCTSLWLELTKLSSTQETLTPEGMLPPILPIVLYIGAQKWTAKTSVKELLPLERGYLLAYQPLQSYILFDVGRMDDEDLASREGLAALIIRAQKSGEATELMTVLTEFITRLTKPEDASLLRSLLRWFKLLLRRGGFGDRVDEIDSLTEVRSMLAERIVHWKDEFVRGEIARGEARGEAKASRDIALRLLMNGIPLEQVVLCTGLSEEEVRALRQ